jgi:Fe-S cluster assembly scaffold protein SufB
MVTKNVEKKAHYFQRDNKIVNLSDIKGVEILSSKDAWKKYDWVKRHFSSKPIEGYFIWVKEQISFPLVSCLLLASHNAKQNLQNLIIIEKGLKVCLVGTCTSAKKTLHGTHKAQGKIILKEGATLDYKHSHSWGEQDILESNYLFLLGKKSHLSYILNLASSPKKFNMENEMIVSEKASCDFKLKGIFNLTRGNIQDRLILKGKDSSGQVQLRMAVKKKSKVSAISEIRADASGKGHLDCQGLLVEKGSSILLEPRLTCNNKEAQITHEASVGKISEEQLNYLRMRGFSETEAIKLIINGFLKV